MVSPVVSFEDFVEELRKAVPTKIEEANKDVDEGLPEILEIKTANRQRSMLINPIEARGYLKELIEKREKTDRFLDVVSAVRGGRIEITEVLKGDRDDERDFILKGRNPQTGVNVKDIRVLLGIPQKKGEDIRNEITQAAFYKALNLHVYREKANLN